HIRPGMNGRRNSAVFDAAIDTGRVDWLALAAEEFAHFVNVHRVVVLLLVALFIVLHVAASCFDAITLDALATEKSVKSVISVISRNILAAIPPAIYAPSRR